MNVGDKFGKLTLVEKVNGYWYCRCTCNGYTYVPADDSLTSGRVKSCGTCR